MKKKPPLSSSTSKTTNAAPTTGQKSDWRTTKLDRDAILTKIDNPSRFSWPPDVRILNAPDLIPVKYELSDKRRPDYCYQGEVFGEFLYEVRNHNPAASFNQVTATVDILTWVWIRVMAHPATKHLPKADRYNLVWAVVGYTEGQSHHTLNQLAKLCKTTT